MLWTSIFVFAANIAAQQCVFGNSLTIFDFQVGKMGRQTWVDILFVGFFKKKLKYFIFNSVKIYGILVRS